MFSEVRHMTVILMTWHSDKPINKLYNKKKIIRESIKERKNKIREDVMLFEWTSLKSVGVI